MDKIITIFIAGIIIAFVIVAIIILTNVAPTISSPEPYNAFASNCSQLESFVNQNINSAVNSNVGGYWMVAETGIANADLQIMHLKGCKVS